eukprot:g871.t1
MNAIPGGDEDRRLVKHPLAFVQARFSQECAKRGENSVTQDREGDWGVSHAAAKRIESGGLDASIPLLDERYLPGTLEPNTLVRVVGMVQDIGDPEMYGRVYRGKNKLTGKEVLVQTQYTENPMFGENVSTDLSTPLSLAERLPVVLVPIPGESAWASSARKERLPSPPASFRSIAMKESGNGSVEQRRRKRTDDEADEDASSRRMRCMTPPTSRVRDVEAAEAEESRPRKQHFRERDRSNNISPPIKGADETPLPPPKGSVLIKVHLGGGDGRATPALKLNEIVDVFGILCVNPEHHRFGSSQGGDDDDSMAVDHPVEDERQSLPCVHVIAIRKRSRRPNDFLPSRVLSTSSSTIPAAKAELDRVLTTVLGGDALAARYLSLMLVSRVHKRMGSMPVGCFPICFDLRRSVWSSQRERGVEGPRSFVARLTALLNALLPAVRRLDMAQESLSERPWYPRKDYERNRLIAGALQMADGTALVVDQTPLREGKIRGVAVANLQALQDVVEHQTIPVDFKYYKTALPVDMPVVVVAEGRPLIKGVCTIALESVSSASGKEEVAAAYSRNESFASSESLRAIRAYLEAARCSDQNIVANDVSPALEKGLADARSKGLKLEQADAHRWITMATLFAKSYGRTKVCATDLSEALRMDEARRARLARAAP